MDWREEVQNSELTASRQQGGMVIAVLDAGINSDHPFADIGGDGYDAATPWKRQLCSRQLLRHR